MKKPRTQVASVFWLRVNLRQNEGNQGEADAYTGKFGMEIKKKTARGGGYMGEGGRGSGEQAKTQRSFLCITEAIIEISNS